MASDDETERNDDDESSSSTTTLSVFTVKRAEADSVSVLTDDPGTNFQETHRPFPTIHHAICTLS